MMPAKRLSSSWFVLGLFLVGLACFMLFLVLWYLFHRYEYLLALLGGTAWVCAYCIVLTENYRKKARVHTRGGWVSYEKNPYLYKWNYLLLFLLGASFYFGLVYAVLVSK
jgi:hypothetical protein